MSGDGHSLAQVFEYVEGAVINKVRREGDDLYLELSDSRVMLFVAPQAVFCMRTDDRGLH